MLTKLTFAVSQHQYLKIHPGQRLVHSDDMFYMAETFLKALSKDGVHSMKIILYTQSEQYRLMIHNLSLTCCGVAGLEYDIQIL